MAALAALIALKMLRTNLPLAALAMGAAGWWFWARKSVHAASPSMTHEEARRLLEVPINATSDEIRAAHRRLVARVHPDVGGSADLTRQVNAARDTLMRHRD
ncbi:MAG TPA: DnaJ domain-containing protein [Sphingomonas sp.]|nr:DnaJ domain-containing protein [Sphingomonas sp.]